MGQSPKVMVVACADSRADPATIFDAAPGQVGPAALPSATPFSAQCHSHNTLAASLARLRPPRSSSWCETWPTSSRRTSPTERCMASQRPWSTPSRCGGWPTHSQHHSPMAARPALAPQASAPAPLVPPPPFISFNLFLLLLLLLLLLLCVCPPPPGAARAAHRRHGPRRVRRRLGGARRASGAGRVPGVRRALGRHAQARPQAGAAPQIPRPPDLSGRLGLFLLANDSTFLFLAPFLFLLLPLNLQSATNQLLVYLHHLFPCISASA